MLITVHGRPLRAACLLLVSLILASCTTAPPRQIVGPELAKLWEDHSRRLSDIVSWNVNGRVAVRTKDDGWNVTLRWQQRSDKDFSIDLSGPFGQGSAALYTEDGNVVLRAPKRPELTATSAEALLLQEFGWEMPVGNLRYWAIGLPDPDASYEMILNDEGRLDRLAQHDWHIDFQRYVSIDGINLPSKISLSNNRVKLKLVVDDWRVNYESGQQQL